MGYLVAASLSEALEALGEPAAAVIAGGTDWFPAQGSRLPRGDLVDITRVPGLRGIARDTGGWRIGGATTWTDVIRANLPPAFDGLKAAAREVGSIQIQNAGTIAGNLCNASPAADGVPPLLTLGAVVELASTGGTRRMPLADFLIGPRQTARQPGEVLTALVIPDLPAAAQGAFLKLGARHYLVISIAMVAAVVTVDRGRVAQAAVAVGSCSATAQRLPALEAELAGRRVADLLAAGSGFVTPAHLAPLAPIADVRGSADYRMEAAATLCARAVKLALTRGNQGHE
ncbi:FAD binding domain-containing protein [Maliponia aquimaris]|uniref:6-hydroxypseudooxynicotine dehydrogenase complex subunit alpha n=1 Tax=Maliponia aquimaris TaxID=1673631 RepID=A0A238JRG9_9RHOB|nr:FAD binding domain-containing protein [Maliponia aquimaris]SMX33145.1 6-hydroxypseudooxynicotine dehydrogenase complex subunit alpha [Maliponia aquimaris]